MSKQANLSFINNQPKHIRLTQISPNKKIYLFYGEHFFVNLNILKVILSLFLLMNNKKREHNFLILKNNYIAKDWAIHSTKTHLGNITTSY